MLDLTQLRGTADAIEVAAPWDCIENVWREMRKALEPMCTVVDCHFSHVYHNGASYMSFIMQRQMETIKQEKKDIFSVSTPQSRPA